MVRSHRLQKQPKKQKNKNNRRGKVLKTAQKTTKHKKKHKNDEDGLRANDKRQTTNGKRYTAKSNAKGLCARKGDTLHRKSGRSTT